MDKKLEEIIKNSSYEIQNDRFVYAKVTNISNIDSHFLIAKDADEITVVTKEKNLGELKLIEKNQNLYKLIALNVSVPFYAVGFLAAVSNAIAAKGMNILIVSTYSKDYILVMENRIREAEDVLLSLGFKKR